MLAFGAALQCCTISQPDQITLPLYKAVSSYGQLLAAMLGFRKGQGRPLTDEGTGKA